MRLIFILRNFSLFCFFHPLCFVLISVANSHCLNFGDPLTGDVFGHSQFLFSLLPLIAEAVDDLGACGCCGSYSCDGRGPLQRYLRANVLKQTHPEVNPYLIC
ncbi:hypothetical protein AMECASPLE_010605 [Ameca splendens]|uniref:Secreted protein n=1 Tax=Ameca splendens TaxID=208324 RepID=A0ABV0ZWF5_9TELE